MEIMSSLDERRMIDMVCEANIRRDMHSFIDDGVGFTTFDKPALFGGDLNHLKERMAAVASGMELTFEMKRVIQIMQATETQQYLQQQFMPSDPSHTTPSTLNIADIRDNNPTFIDVLQELKGLQKTIQSQLFQATKCELTRHNRWLFESRRKDSPRSQKSYSQVIDYNRAANWQAEHARSRGSFMTAVGLPKAQVLRVIDIKATRTPATKHVVLVDYWDDIGVQEVGYTAISHTYGMDVYQVFDCPCATECSAKVHKPRCSNKPCPHGPQHSSSASSEKHKNVVNDILTMCDILGKAGVSYCWHDGVCIAQHDEEEVKETIKHIGWIYGNANETVIFLHYVGRPMAPIRNSNNHDDLSCRWHTRVWTLQEAALSKCRRYCVRVGDSPLDDCQSFEEFEEKLDLWYAENSSTVKIVEEEWFFDFLQKIDRVLCFLGVDNAKMVLSIPDDANDDVIIESNWMWMKINEWRKCTAGLLSTLLWTCFEFPTIYRALTMCGSRESKHRGDRINSILALAKVKDFVAPKDVDVEASTIDFFMKQGQLGLANAVLASINSALVAADAYFSDERRHTWLPVLWSYVATYKIEHIPVDDVKFNVLEDRSMEVRADLVCVKVRLTAKRHEPQIINPDMEENDGSCLDMDLTSSEGVEKFRVELCGTSIVCGKWVRISAMEGCSTQTQVLAMKIEDGESFHVHLVIPKCMPAYSLIVQGSLHASVSKVGIFTATDQFLEILANFGYLPAITIIHKLIIT